jgi:hypothetical protein
MSDARLRPVPSPGEVAEDAAAPRPLVLDGRKPHRLDAAGPVLLLAAGYADLFAVRIAADGRSESAREHLFRVEPGEIIAPMPIACWNAPIRPWRSPSSVRRRGALPASIAR